MAKRFMILCIIYPLYLLLGGIAFWTLEWTEEEEQIILEPQEWTRLKVIMADPGAPPNEDELSTLVGWLLQKCSNLPNNVSGFITTPGNQSWLHSDIERRCYHLHVEKVESVVIYPWKFIDALYFSMTVITTIGYGHISPTRPMGQIVCIFYSLVGIPLTGMLLAWTSGFFGERLFDLFTRKLDARRQKSNSFIFLGTVVYIMIGFVIFIFLPSIAFCYIEDWSYLQAVYYSYITLTTIGFGDYVTGKSMSGNWLYIYQIVVILWILVGLGYWVMVANFITRALESQHMSKLALKAAEIKKTLAQMGIVNNDPKFLSHTSKATLNFMIQLSSNLADPELQSQYGSKHGPLSLGAPMGPIPGINALFGKSGMGVAPTKFFSQFLEPTKMEPPDGKPGADSDDISPTNHGHLEIDSGLRDCSLHLLTEDTSAEPKDSDIDKDISQDSIDVMHSSDWTVKTADETLSSIKTIPKEINEDDDVHSCDEVDDLPQEYIYPEAIPRDAQPGFEEPAKNKLYPYKTLQEIANSQEN